MKKLKGYVVAAILVAVLLAAGLVASSDLFAAPAQAQEEEKVKSAKQWETTVVRGGAVPEGLQGVLNIKGEEGWELVEVIQARDGNFVAFLKRRKQ